ncbi:hypothetical protein BC826DRAFT_967494 [Russula brevipes]|nr:hypothetical protein BC826DRAFT_967494 [Russula brevipes]
MSNWINPSWTEGMRRVQNHWLVPLGVINTIVKTEGAMALHVSPWGKFQDMGMGMKDPPPTYIALVHFRDPTSKLYLYTCSRGNPAQYDEKGVHPNDVVQNYARDWSSSHRIGEIANVRLVSRLIYHRHRSPKAELDAITNNPTSSNLTSVVYQDVDKWAQLGDNTYLSRMHARFWRVSIADERRDWWSNQQGKTYWISYAIRRRLGEGEAFLWCRGKLCYLFVEEGVFQRHRDLMDHISFRPFIWTFSDANDTLDGVLFPIAATSSTLFNIYVTSPERSRWKNLKKATILRTVIMNPWTKDEIFQAARTRGIEPAEKKRIEELFDQYGGIPRICLDFLRNPDHLAELQNDSENAIQDSTGRTLYDYISKATLLSFSEVPHAIFMIKRTDLDDLQTMTIIPASPAIGIRLKSKFLTLQHAEQIQLYEWLASVMPSRQMAGLVFESLAQSMLQRRVALKLVPLQERFLGPGKEMRWVSTYEDQMSRTTRAPDADSKWKNEGSTANQRSTGPVGAYSSITVDFSPREIVEYEETTIQQEEIEGVFFIPKLTNQVAFDPFIVFDGVLTQHQARLDILAFKANASRPTPTEDEMVFRLVIPSGNTLSCPQPHDRGFTEFLKDVRLFSAQLELDKDPARDGRVGKKKPVAPKDYKGKRKAADGDDSGTAVVEGTKGRAGSQEVLVDSVSLSHVVEARYGTNGA